MLLGGKRGWAWCQVTRNALVMKMGYLPRDGMRNCWLPDVSMDKTTMFLFLISICAAVLVLTVYFGIIRHVTHRKRWRFVWTAVTALLASSFIWAMRGRRFIQPDSGIYDLVTIGYYVMMVAIVLCCLVLLRDCVVAVWDLVHLGRRMVRGKVGKTQEKAEKKEEDKTEIYVDKSELKEKNNSDSSSSEVLTRRQFLLRGSSYGVLAGTAVLSPPAVWAAKCGRKLREIDLPMGRWPSALDGFKIAHLSDIHVGNTITKSDVSAIVEETNALEPDLIVITGDIADGVAKYVAPALEPMRHFKAKYGVFYVTGNHEHMWGARAWCQAVADLGITVLNNEHRIIDAAGVSFAVAGATDCSGLWREKNWTSDPAAALSGIEENVFRLMLVHQPKMVEESFAHGADLVLLGHTHGGQFWPACYVVDMVHKYSRGLYREGEKVAFVSCGTGYWGPPLRLGVPPEICLITLRHGSP